MFKRILLIVLAFAIGLLTFDYFGKKEIQNVEVANSPDVLGVPLEEFPKQVDVAQNSYNVFWYSPEIEDMILIPNYNEKLTADEVTEKYQCRFIINGGFYDEKRSPLGLVIADSQKVSDFRESDLFNGVFTINSLAIPRITKYAPDDSLVVAVQSGPIVFANGKEMPISMENDKNARRSMVAVTGKNELIFIHVTGIDNSYFGTTMEELPILISELNKKYDLRIADALNLDGGSASVYIKDDTRIKEISLPGAYFCEQ